VLNVFTVDVEDYFQVSAFERTVARAAWDSFPSRVVDNTERLLRLLDRHQVQGTFFVLGWVARRYPELVRSIHAAGHELASHGFWHRLVYEQTPDEFRQDLRDSRDAIAAAAGTVVTMYRAPSFSITARSLWALDVLLEEGFTLDASVFPIRHDRYGLPHAQRTLHRLPTPAGDSIWEFPASTARLLGMNLPVAGGGYFRLYPWNVTRRLLGRINNAEQRPFMFYTHPWEIDPDQPRIAGPGLRSRFRHYVNLASTAGKLERLLERFHFTTLGAAMRQMAHNLSSLPLERAECPA
jgi:polysaccharide deacetylase family protein (PEP-CTERM system associated)